MLCLFDLWKEYEGETLYIVGTGPSARFFDFSFLQGKLSIGLNQAYQYYNHTWNITIHPELIPYDAPAGKWITKLKGPLLNQVKPQRQFYLFENNKDVLNFAFCERGQHDNRLYVGRGIHTGALCFAAKAGFKNCVLIGCDFNEVNGFHHAHDQHTQFHGLTPTQVYNEYYENAAKLRSVLFELYKIQILSLSPFLGEGHHKQEFSSLCQIHRLEPTAPDVCNITSYTRTSTDF